MTGLDQDMMQKNLSCRNIREARKNMYWMSLSLVPVNLLFLSLGALLYIFAQRNGIVIPEHSDDLFPMIATGGYPRGTRSPSCSSSALWPLHIPAPIRPSPP